MTGNGPDVFLSHNSHDKPFVDAVAQALEKAGLRCEFDKWDLHPAGNWLRELEAALKGCKFFVLFIGPNGLGPYHQAELDVALQRQIQERRKLIIPVLLPGTTPKVLENISVFLTSIQALAFSKQDDDFALRLLIGLLNEDDPQLIREILKQPSAPKYLLRSVQEWFSGLTIGWKENVCEVAIGQGEKCLTIPFKTRQARLDNVASQLEWNYELTGFMGRERELEQLQRWADSDYPIAIQPVVGEGGVGKTRLAFEFAARLRQQGWQAGEAGQTLEGSWYIGSVGILLVIDYPEHRSERVTQLLEALDDLESPAIKIRILLLTRHADFAERLSQSARALIRPALQLNGLSDTQMQWDLLQAAWTSLGALEQPQADKELPVDETAFSHWIARDNFHRNPLIILALAVYLFSATHKKHQNLLDIHGREVVRELTLREIKRIKKEIPKAFQAGTILIKALAAITGGLDLHQCNTLLNTVKQKCISPVAPDITQLQEYSIVTNNCIQPLSPDIFAADFLIYALTEYAKLHSPQWQLAVLEFTENRLQNWSRFGRLVFDAQYKLNHRWRMDELVIAVVQDNELCEWIANEFVYQSPREVRLNPIGIAALKKNIESNDLTPPQQAEIYSMLSILLAENGDREGTLAIIKQAVEIREQLTQENFSAYGPFLAMSLNNLSVRLSENGNRMDGLATSKRAAEIYEQLARENFSVYGSYLASSLNNLSNRLSESGDHGSGLATSSRAVEIYEQLAQENFKAYSPDLAMSLNNLSICLGENGGRSSGLATIWRAVDIYEQLAQENFSFYGPNLASSLNNLSICLSESDDHRGGLATSRRAVEIYEQLAQENFSAYSPKLAMSLNNLSNRLSESGDSTGGLATIKRAIEIREQLAQENFSAYGSDLASSLINLSACLNNNGDPTGGRVTIKRAVEICEQLAKENFNAFGESLCLSLCIQFFNFEQEIVLLNQLWKVYQQVKWFTHRFFEDGFESEIVSMLEALLEQGDDAMVAKLQEIHDTLTKTQAEKSL